MTRLDYDAIGRVLKVATAWGAPKPEGSDGHTWRNALSDDIAFAYLLFRNYADWTSDSRARRRDAALASAAEKAGKLLELIENDDLPLSSSLGRHMMPGTLAETLTGLQAIVDAATAERARLAKAGLNTGAILEPDPHVTRRGEFIARMQKAFSAAFGVPGKIVYEGQEPSGPFLAFVSASMRECAALDRQPTPIADTPEAVAQTLVRAGLS